MKKALFTILVILISSAAFSQSLPPVDGVPLGTADDYRAAENIVLQTSGYLLSNPIDKDDESRLKAGVFITRWMGGTPHFDFATGQKPLRFIKRDVELLSVYYATLTSFAIRYNPGADAQRFFIERKRHCPAGEVTAYFSRWSIKPFVTFSKPAPG